MKSDYPFPDKCEKCIHNDVCYMVGECLNHIPDFECDCFEEKRPHGEWEKYGDKIEAYDISGIKTWGQKRKCTKCGFIKTYIEDFGIYPFCPNCSALMWKEGVAKDE